MDRRFDRRESDYYNYRLSRQERGTCHAGHQDRVIGWERAKGRPREVKISNSNEPEWKRVEHKLSKSCRWAYWGPLRNCEVARSLNKETRMDMLGCHHRYS